MRYATVCSGIEAPTQAWHGLGWEPVWFSEIERFPSAVLKHHYPEVPNLGDMTKIHEDETYQKTAGTIDIFCGGTPCQSFSVAGLRKGLADPRGNLALHFLRIVDDLRPRWVVWENVPGVLSSSGGRDFGSFLGALGQLGYGFAYRVLDAQYFGVPQRRRRVFVVGHLGGWRGAAAVLFDTESLRGNPPPSREAGQKTAGTLAQSSKGSGGIGYSNQELFSQNGDGLITPEDMQITGALCAGDFKSLSDQQAGNGKFVATVIKGAAIGRKPENGPQYGEVLQDGSCYTLNCTERHAVAFAQNTRDEVRYINGDGQIAGAIAAQPGMKQQSYVFQSKASASNSMNPAEVAPSIDVGKSDGLATYSEHAVRRLTPRECERLQGFSDNFTRIPYRGKPASQCPDGPRYKALGNSMAVPVMRWIGEQIQRYEEITT